MSKTRRPFTLKQFSIAHDKVALPVTSDACLFGAMIPLSANYGDANLQVKSVLDIGTGTGLLCMMLAQKHPEIQFTGIDIHPDSIVQANQNKENSPFPAQLHFQLADVLSYSPAQPFDAIVCNPPFFEQQLPSADETRRLARHSDTLTLASLLTACHKLLNHHGELFLLYPPIDERTLEVILNQAQFSLRALTQIRATESKAPHLHIIQAKAMPENTSQYLQYENCETKTIVHYESNGKLSQEATGYLQEYYSILP
jgi:tRNA1Val (adenine37-N6)-methyltransferase